MRLIALLALAAPLAIASTNLEQAIDQCRAETDSLKRLMCYDQITTTANKSDTGAKPAVVAVAPVVTPVPAAKVVIEAPNQQAASYGLKEKAVDAIDNIKAKVIKQKKNAYGYYIWTLDNGQVWQQKQRDYIKLDRSKNIIISDGALGSFWLSQEGINKRTRVKRIK